MNYRYGCCNSYRRKLLKLSLTVKSVTLLFNMKNSKTCLELSTHKPFNDPIFACEKNMFSVRQYVLVKLRMFDNTVERTNVVSSNFEFPDSPKSSGVLGAKSL